LEELDEEEEMELLRADKAIGGKMMERLN